MAIHRCRVCDSPDYAMFTLSPPQRLKGFPRVEESAEKNECSCKIPWMPALTLFSGYTSHPIEPLRKRVPTCAKLKYPREVVKSTQLEQDPPNPTTVDDLYLQLPPPPPPAPLTQQMVFIA